MDKPILYRKRLIPQECVLLKDDVILECSEDIILTKWCALKPKKYLHHGYSCYFPKEGIKVTRKDKNKFYDQILEDSNMTEEEFEKATEMSVKDWVKANHYESQPLRDKVLDFVYDNGKITEK